MVWFSLSSDLCSFSILLYPRSPFHLITPLSLPSIFRKMLAFLPTRARQKSKYTSASLSEQLCLKTLHEGTTEQS